MLISCRLFFNRKPLLGFTLELVSIIYNVSALGNYFECEGVKMYFLRLYLRLAFTNDEVVVGVVLRRVERYNLVKIKPTESEAKH